MSEILEVKIYDDNSGYNHSQEINTKLSNGNYLHFEAYDLCDCPEDAILERDLFDADDYINALNTGIMLAKMGYDEVVGKTVEIEDNEEEADND